MTPVIETGRERQRELGQFFTAPWVADMMAVMFDALPKTLRLLDAGAGDGALTKAFVRRICTKADGIESVEATLYEIDPAVLDRLAAEMRECERRCVEAGIRFGFTIHEVDFIAEMSSRHSGDLFSETAPTFDTAIVNPPYRKIHAVSSERSALRSIGVETSNLYAGFIAVIQRLLVPGGQLVAITPRSFCNGLYFRPFREDFLSSLQLHRIHTFESRKAAFRQDSVLQENVIFHAVKERATPRSVIISSSSGTFADRITETVVPFSDIVSPDDEEKFIHIPSSSSHVGAKRSLDRLTANLSSLGLTVSTGPVVEFRLKESIRQSPEQGTVPLLYPTHFNGGTVHWPKPGGRKANAILDNEETRPWLVPSGIYLLTKRFTSKEERRRLVACLFDPEQVKATRLGLENHLNYFHAQGRGLDRTLAFGLYAFLNSTVVDQYFRRFSGHTQVNAGDLRQLAYPARETLEAMGAEAGLLDFSQENIDELVTKHLHAGS